MPGAGYKGRVERNLLLCTPAHHWVGQRIMRIINLDSASLDWTAHHWIEQHMIGLMSVSVDIKSASVHHWIQQIIIGLMSASLDYKSISASLDSKAHHLHYWFEQRIIRIIRLDSASSSSLDWALLFCILLESDEKNRSCLNAWRPDGTDTHYYKTLVGRN